MAPRAAAHAPLRRPTPPRSRYARRPRAPDKLNELGSEGWEVVARVGYEVVDSIVLKRPRAAAGKRRGPRDGASAG